MIVFDRQKVVLTNKSGAEKRASEVVREHIHSLKSFVSGIGTNA